jgi:hypothetical protein
MAPKTELTTVAKGSESSAEESLVANESSGCCGSSSSKSVVTSGRQLGVWEQSLEDQSPLHSNWTLSYLSPLLSLGSRKVLEQDDIGLPSRQDRAAHAYEIAMRQWEVQSAKAHAVNDKLRAAYEVELAACTTPEAKKDLPEPSYKEPSAAAALLAAFGTYRIVLALGLNVLSSLLTFVPVLILNNLVKFFESGEDLDEYDGIHPWIQVALLGVLPVMISLLQTRSQVIMAHCAVFVRTAVSTMLYRKALRVSSAGRAMTSTGQVVNMMSNDTAQLQRFLQFMGMTLTAPVTLVVALFFIYQQVRLWLVRCIVSVGSGSLTLPFSFLISGWLRDVGGCRLYGISHAH